MVKGWLGTLTSEERLILHLFENQLREGQWDVGPELTQAGIASAIHLQRKHVPRTIKQAINRELVYDDTRHIIGARQRRRVYGLTYSGKEMAESLRTRLMKLEVGYEGGTKPLTNFIPEHSSLLLALAHVGDDCAWNEKPIVDALDADSQSHIDMKVKDKIIRAVLTQAWKDGFLSSDEQGLIEAITKVLKIGEDVISAVTKQVRAEAPTPTEAPQDVYAELLDQALSGNIIIEEEAAMLATLRNAIGISKAEHDELLSEAQTRRGQSPSQNLLAYSDAVRVALADRIITDDEEALLASLRSSLGISNSQHEEILLAEREKLN